MIFNNLNIFEFDWTDVLLLFVGIGIGLLIALFFYIFLVLYTIKPKQYIVKSKSEGLTDEEIDEK